MNPWKYFYPPENRQLKQTGSEKIQLVALWAISYVQNSLLRLFARVIYRKPADPKRILIFRTGSIGDSVCAIPSIIAISKFYPRAQLDILTNAGAASLVGLGAFLPEGKFNECIDYREWGRKQLISVLRKRKYDLVIQLPQVDSGFIRLLRDLVLFRLVARAGWGWEKGQVMLFRKTQAKFILFPPEVVRLLNLLRQKGIAAEVPQKFVYPKTADAVFVRKWMEQHAGDDHKPVLAVVVGAKRPQNRWPLSHFEQVIKHFEEDYTIVAVGGPDDAAAISQIQANCKILNACGTFSPMQSAALLEFAILTISNDTGPMHLSYAAGTPTLAIFSSRDLPGKWYPVGADHFVFRTPMLCQACYSSMCANNDNVCMKAIAPGAVIEQAERMLDRIRKNPVN